MTPIAPTVNVMDAVIKALVNCGSRLLPVFNFSHSPMAVMRLSKSINSPIIAPSTIEIIIIIGPVVCKLSLTMTSINCIVPLMPKRRIMIPHTIMSVSFKFSFMRCRIKRPNRLPQIINTTLRMVPIPCIGCSSSF